MPEKWRAGWNGGSFGVVSYISKVFAMQCGFLVCISKWVGFIYLIPDL